MGEFSGSQSFSQASTWLNPQRALPNLISENTSDDNYEGGNMRMQALLETSLTPDGGLFADVIDVMRRLANDPLLSSTAQHADQLDQVLQGARLSDSEIEALPKVRFERTEEQSCTICLEK